MAFDYFGQQDDEQQQGQGNQNQSQQQGSGENQTQLGSQSPVVTGSEPSSGAKTASGSFTNLQSYLDANKGLNFGQEVAGKVQNQVAGAETAQNQAEQGFKSAVDQGTVNKNTDLLSSVRTDPNAILQDQAKKSEFEKMRDASYAGPKDLAERSDLYNPAYSATDKAYQTAQKTKDESGRKAYLQEQYGAGVGRYDYSSGKQKLDNLLIQQDPGAKQAFQQTQQAAEAAKNRFGTMKNELQGYAGAAQNKTAQTRLDTLGTLGLDQDGNWLNVDGVQGNQGAMQDTLEALDSMVTGKKAQRNTDATTLAGTYGKSNVSQLSPQQLQMLGIQANDPRIAGLAFNYDPLNGLEPQNTAPFKNASGALLGYDPRNYSSVVDESTLNRSSLADSQTQAKINALAQLANKNNSFIDPGQAGSMVNKALYTADGSKLLNDATTRKGALGTGLDKIKQDVLRSKAQGGLTDPTKVRQMGNAERAKYGLPPL